MSHYSCWRYPCGIRSGGRGDRGVCRVTIEKLWASFRFTWRIDFPLSLSLFPFPRKRHRGEKRRYLSKEQPVGLNRSWVGSMATGNTATKAEFPGVGWKRSTRPSPPFLERCKETEAEKERKIERKARWKETGAFFKRDAQWWICIGRIGGDLCFIFSLFFNALRSSVDVDPKSSLSGSRRGRNWSLFRFGWDSNRDRAGIVLGIGKSLDCWQYVGEGKEV